MLASCVTRTASLGLLRPIRARARTHIHTFTHTAGQEPERAKGTVNRKHAELTKDRGVILDR